MKQRRNSFSHLSSSFKFHVWLDMLKSLGGTYEPVRDPSEIKPRTGRRDPDTKPRQYPVGTTKAFWETKNIVLEAA